MVRERLPGERRRPQRLALPAEVRDEHPERDRHDDAGASAPPWARCSRGEAADCLDGRHQPVSPAIAVRTASLSTTPTTRPSSIAQTGRSLSTISGTALL